MRGRLLFITLCIAVEAPEMTAPAQRAAGVVGLLAHRVPAALVRLMERPLANFRVRGALIGGAIRWPDLICAGVAALALLGIARETVLLVLGIAVEGGAAWPSVWAETNWPVRF